VRTGRIILGACLFLALITIPSCRKKALPVPSDPLRNAYDIEPDWNDPQQLISLNYQQAQGKRIFYQDCVWCHADATPAGPSNRSNLSPQPPVMNDGATLNGESDEFFQNIIALGGSAVGKSAMMPPYGRTLTQDEIHAIIAYTRSIAVPLYRPPARPGPSYSGKGENESHK
jgi:mono/diheme cytochrome c family protein